MFLPAGYLKINFFNVCVYIGYVTVLKLGLKRMALFHIPTMTLYGQHWALQLLCITRYEET